MISNNNNNKDDDDDDESITYAEYPRVNDTEDLLRQIKILGFVADWWTFIKFIFFLIIFSITKYLKNKYIGNRIDAELKKHIQKKD
mmetsp:Transcript_30508/g.39329  ORF Transcript_30508/g.39329 Transcript_30508/m.39329 type:complete len:86 (-) Transcript_30508:196-453(-)